MVGRKITRESIKKKIKLLAYRDKVITAFKELGISSRRLRKVQMVVKDSYFWERLRLGDSWEDVICECRNFVNLQNKIFYFLIIFEEEYILEIRIKELV